MRRVTRGLYRGDDVRAERIHVNGGWATEVKCRRIGETRYFEYHPNGDWHHIGTFRTLASAEAARDLLKSGNYVLSPAHYSSELGDMRTALVLWTSVCDVIAAHPSVKGV
jgi:hypothetical protein